MAGRQTLQAAPNHLERSKMHILGPHLPAVESNLSFLTKFSPLLPLRSLSGFHRQPVTTESLNPVIWGSVGAEATTEAAAHTH